VSIEFESLVPLGRRGLIQATNLVVTVLIAVLAITKLVVMGLEHPPIPALFVVVAGLANAVYLRRGGSMDVVAWILVGFSLMGIAAGSFNTGGFAGSILLLAPLIPVLTMLLIDSRAAWIALVLVCLILAGLFALGLNGFVPENPNGPDRVRLGRYIVLTCLCVISTWVVWSFSAMTRSLLIKLDKQSNTDYLTGVLNRRAIESALSQEVGRARRTDTYLSFIMADVDFFKLYNDSNGHQAGDRCLIDIAKLICSCCERSTDFVGRFGGEEFVIILPDTDSEGAQRVAGNIRTTIVQRSIPYGPNNSDPVTLTLGVVSARGPLIEDIDQVIRQADSALYRGKNSGRNCAVAVVINDDEPNDLDHLES